MKPTMIITGMVINVARNAGDSRPSSLRVGELDAEAESGESSSAVTRPE